ncbi:MAG: hypothetical protein AAF997_21300 [Myxococcota bacterium]
MIARSRKSRAALLSVALVMGCGGSGATSSAGGSGGGGDTGGVGGVGGSGGSDSGLRGALIGPPVSGVTYETATRSGVTDEDGTFRYEPGETVTFRIGSTILGEANGQAEVTVFDLVPQASIVVGTSRLHEELLERVKSPFRTVVNLSVFLQTLDADDDPMNGIMISEAAANLFANVSIDFAVPPRGFASVFAFREALARANSDSLFGEPRAPAGAARAMSHLYEALGVDPEIFLPATVGIGPLEGPVGQTLTYTYDPQGNLVRRDSDVGTLGQPPDGVPERFDAWTYDENNNMLTYLNNRGEFTPSRLTTWTYSPEGFVTSETLDVDEDGLPEREERWTYDENGSVTRYTRDDEGDGVLNLVEVSTYDRDGNRTRLEADFNDDGMPDRVETWDYEENGNLSRFERDSNNDGVPNRIETFEYDGNGELARRLIDLNGDGDTNQIRSFEYDDAGNTLLDARDDGADGSINFTTTTGYDEFCNVTRQEIDEGADGIAVAVTERTYEAGRIVLIETDSDGDGMIDRLITYIRDDDGNLLRFERDEGADGVLERLETAGYDENGSQIFLERTDVQTVFNSRRTRTFDSEGWGIVMFLASVKSYDLVTNF